MAEESKCCSAAPKLIFSCSGAADVGCVADRAARKMTSDGSGKMFCLTGIGGRVPGIMKNTEAAQKILAIDGCPLECAAHCLKQAGFEEFEHVMLGELGLDKGETAITDDNVAIVARKGAELLA